MLTRIGLVLTRVDSCWLVLIRVDSCRTSVDSSWLVSDLCWLVSDSCWFVLTRVGLVLTRVRLVLIRVDLCWFVLTSVDLDWYSCIRIDFIHLDGSCILRLRWCLDSWSLELFSMQTMRVDKNIFYDQSIRKEFFKRRGVNQIVW